MRKMLWLISGIAAGSLGVGCRAPAANEGAAGGEGARAAGAPAPLDMAKAEEEVRAHYGKAHPEIQEYVLWTARQFGPGGLWLNEDALAGLSRKARDERVRYLAKLLEEGDYGRALCRGLAEAGAIKDPRLVPGLMQVAAYHRDDLDYDCRAKWMAVAALARQEADEAVPRLISLVDHGNENTRKWARAALARKTGQDLGHDKQAWAKGWQDKGHPTIAADLLQPWKAPPPPAK